MNRRVLASLVVYNLLLAIAVLAGLAVLLTQNETWDPLGDYPIQEATVQPDGTVFSVGIKCNDSDSPVSIRGSFTWQKVEPPGFNLTNEGTGVRDPGCTRSEFINTPPAEVLAVNNPGDVWKLTGIEYPINEDGTEGEPRVWETNTFILTEET